MRDPHFWAGESVLWSLVPFNFFDFQSPPTESSLSGESSDNFPECIPQIKTSFISS
jgi:hypothetical protein